MNLETKNCQNCKTDFVIEPEDVGFYKKLKVPPPTFCPQCRLQRRLTWRNERTLYHAACAATGKKILTMFSPESGVQVYDHDYWWSDKWDQLSVGRDYDFTRPFFAQFQELMRAAPLPNLANTNVVRTEYANHNYNAKDCYLIFAADDNENVFYSSGPAQCKDSMDIYVSLKAEQCYDVTLSDYVSRVFFAYDLTAVVNSMFIDYCVNVTDSIGCVNLRNKSNYIFNQPYSKEEYKTEIAKPEYDFGSYKTFVAFREKFAAFIKKFPRRFAGLLRTTNVTGDMIGDAKNCQECFDVYGNVEDSKYLIHALAIKNSYDGYGVGINAELLYETVDSGIDGARYVTAVYTYGCHDTHYTYCCHGSSHLFGCVGLRNKQYCIFNKQYSKEEYEKLVPRIIEQMNASPYRDALGRTYGYGEFFPQEISPFAYNETIAQEYVPLAEADARAAGFSWRAATKKDYAITIEAADLPDHIKDVSDDILNQTIGCAHAGACQHQCTTAFKIVPAELQFYRNYNLALPRLCSNCRHYGRLAQRNPFKLWDRQCTCKGSGAGDYTNTIHHFHGTEPCPNTFKTAYAPERPEIVYCEQCYQAEVM